MAGFRGAGVTEVGGFSEISNEMAVFLRSGRGGGWRGFSEISNEMAGLKCVWNLAEAATAARRRKRSRKQGELTHRELRLDSFVKAARSPSLATALADTLFIGSRWYHRVR